MDCRHLIMPILHDELDGIDDDGCDFLPVGI